ncbi:MAG: hypothetical protein ACREXI_02130 [Caldimonas sp.]
MNASNLTRAVALVASLFMTFGTVDPMAGYAFRDAPVAQLASPC